MEIPILLSALYLVAISIKSREKFMASAVIFSIGFCITAIELMTETHGLLVYFGLTASLLRIPSIKLSPLDILLWGFLTTVLVFWLSTSEFIDGYVFSFVAISSLLAVICNVIFDKKNRQTLCASALLSAFAICLLLKANVYVADVVLALVLSIALTENFSAKRNSDIFKPSYSLD